MFWPMVSGLFGGEGDAVMPQDLMIGDRNRVGDGGPDRMGGISLRTIDRVRHSRPSLVEGRACLYPGWKGVPFRVPSNGTDFEQAALLSFQKG